MPISDSSAEASVATVLQQEVDTASSNHDDPPLPRLGDKGKFLVDPSENWRTGDEKSLPHCPLFYSEIPRCSDSGTEGGDEFGFDPFPRDPAGPSTSTVRRPDAMMHELSGRSRALLKEKFEKTKPFALPMGHPTLAFTESQINNLLDNETMSLTYLTFERMILDALKVTAATAQSRTDDFKSEARTQTPMRRVDSDSSFASHTDSEVISQPELEVGPRDVTSCGDSDGSTEMSLISESFWKSTAIDAVLVKTTTSACRVSSEGFESSRPTSQDVNLSEIPERRQDEKCLGEPRSKISKKTRRTPQRIKTIETMGTMEISRHHRTEKHLRRDQRCVYEHLKSTDHITGKVQHQVRGRNGKLLSKILLAKEIPQFIHMELVDIEERIPFYEDFVRGHASAIVTPESRAETQLSIIRDFIKTYGAFTVLGNLLGRIDSFTDFQAPLCDLDWGDKKLTVSIICISIQLTDL